VADGRQLGASVGTKNAARGIEVVDRPANAQIIEAVTQELGRALLEVSVGVERSKMRLSSCRRNDRVPGGRGVSERERGRSRALEGKRSRNRWTCRNSNKTLLQSYSHSSDEIEVGSGGW
jgi:hypothetical protein